MGAIPPEGGAENAVTGTPCIQSRQTQTFASMSLDGHGAGDLYPAGAFNPYGQ